MFERKDTLEYWKEKWNWDSKLCKLWDVCKNAIKCILLSCKDFASKVKKKGNPHDPNDNRLDY